MPLSFQEYVTRVGQLVKSGTPYEQANAQVLSQYGMNKPSQTAQNSQPQPLPVKPDAPPPGK